MFAYVLRRLGALIIILLGSSFLIYNLAAISTDPLEGLKTSTAQNKEQLIASLTRELRLDLPPPLRYFLWLRGVLGIFVGNPDFGNTREQQSVVEAIANAIPTTIRLVFVATIVALVLGLALGITSALRQYSRFDYGMTFFAFLLFSLPIFWVAVLLKQYLAIDFNDFLVTATISPPWIIGLSLVTGFFWAAIISGSRKRVSLVFSIAFVALVYFPAQIVLGSDRPRFGIFVLLLTLLITAVSVSFIFARIDRGPIIRTSIITSILIGGLILVDQMMQAWRPYVESDDVNYRPVATIGQSTIWLSEATFWIRVLDFAMHLLLPTLALTLISFAGYIRFSRGTLLDVLNQDYIRTARAKGLTERTVVMRHAFRNTMIPLTTIMVGDVAGIVGGAIITERVFAWQGMGTLFNKAITSFDLNLLMGVILFLSTLAIVANLIADLLYSALDPRIRVGAGKK